MGENKSLIVSNLKDNFVFYNFGLIFIVLTLIPVKNNNSVLAAEIWRRWNNNDKKHEQSED